MRPSFLSRHRRRRESAHRLYGILVSQARRPEFYRVLGVPDTPQGRFELIALHVFLVLYRLKGERDEAARLGQAVFDLLFSDMDRNLREMGVGDLAVGRRVKALAKGFYGRVAAYEAGLAANDGTLAAALDRNLYGTATPTPAQTSAMVAYLRREARALAGQESGSLLDGEVRFGPPPGVRDMGSESGGPT